MLMNRRRPTLRDERGQTMVEFALVIPILCVVLFAVIQFGVLYNDYVTLTDATRVGARKAATSRHEADPVGVTVAKVESSASGLDLAKLDVSVTGTWEHGEDVTVAAKYPYEIDLLGFVVASGDLESETTERVE
jgi:Flp pilus assembly protein TadG